VTRTSEFSFPRKWKRSVSPLWGAFLLGVDSIAFSFFSPTRTEGCFGLPDSLFPYCFPLVSKNGRPTSLLLRFHASSGPWSRPAHFFLPSHPSLFPASYFSLAPPLPCSVEGPLVKFPHPPEMTLSVVVPFTSSLFGGH